MTQARPDEDPASRATAPTGTEAVAAEAALYQGLFTASADALLVADAAGRYLDANPAATALLGYPRRAAAAERGRRGRGRASVGNV